MEFLNIIDFRKSLAYSHLSISQYTQSMKDLPILCVLYDKIQNTHRNIVYFLEKIVRRRVFNEVDLKSYYDADGIYDIFLEKCKNVREVKIIRNDHVIFTKAYNGTEEIIQIPLSLSTNNEPVKTMFYIKDKKGPTTVSFIPIKAMFDQEIKIKLNEGAEAHMIVSLLWLSDYKFKHRLMNSNIRFYIAGKPFFTNKKVRKQWLCFR